MALPFADNTFQAATNGFALRNVVDIQKTISEMARVVAPGGRVVCIDVSVPQFFLFRWFFNVYYYKLVPIMGHQVDKNKKIGSKFPAYTWLAESLRTLPPQEEIRHAGRGLSGRRLWRGDHLLGYQVRQPIRRAAGPKAV